MTPLRPAAPAPAPACPARPCRAHADAEDPIPPARWGAGCRGPEGPRSGRAARQRGAGAQGGARAEQGRPSPHSAARRPPASPPRERQGRRPPCPVRRPRATPSAPGGGLREPGLRSAGPVDHLHPGCAGPAASRVPGTPAYLGRSFPGRGAALVAPAARRASSGARAAAGPLGGAARWIPSLPQLRAASPHAGTLPPAQPPPPGGRPPLHVTHQEHTPRQRPSLRLAHTPPITPPWVLYPLTRTF